MGPPAVRLPLRVTRSPTASLVVLLAIALVLRVWSIAAIPAGMDSDEVAFGYNAYSLLKTGRDEYGVAWPTTLRSFGEYKRPAFAYFSVPFVAVFGPTPLGARLPGAVAGTLAVGAMYAVASQLLRSTRLGLAAAGMLSISPWHLQFSRGAREVSLEFLCVLSLVAALLRALHTRGWAAGAWLLVASACLVLAIYSYPGALGFAPLLAATVLWCYRARWRRLPLGGVAAAAAGTAVALLPIVAQLSDGRVEARLAKVSIWSQPHILALASSRGQGGDAGSPLALLHAVPLLVAQEVVGGYLSHFSPTFLFTAGDGIARHHASGSGLLYLWDLPLLAVGGLVLTRHLSRPAAQLTGAWLLAGPLPAALATPAPHAVRALTMLPAWYLLAAMGAPALWRWLRRRRLQFDWCVLLVGSVALYLTAYYVHSPREQAAAWQGGWLEAFSAAKAEVDQGRADRVVIDPGLEVGYIFALFGTRYDPAQYLAHGGTQTSPAWVAYPEPGPISFAPFELRDVDWATAPRDERTFYMVNAVNRLPAGAATVRVFKNTAGQEALRLIVLAS